MLFLRHHKQGYKLYPILTVQLCALQLQERFILFSVLVYYVCYFICYVDRWNLSPSFRSLCVWLEWQQRILEFLRFSLQSFLTTPPSLRLSMWRRSMMRLRVRKAPQQPTLGRRSHLSQAKRKHCEVAPSPVRRRGKMQKNETGLLSTIKKFIRGNAVKVCSHYDSWLLLCFVLFFFV